VHNRSKHNCTILKVRVNDPGLAFTGKVGLGPFWTWVQVLSYVHARQLFVGTFVPSLRHERPSTVGRIYTKMQCSIYVMIFILINHEPIEDNQGVFWLGTFT
jgi:hypothetical protein